MKVTFWGVRGSIPVPGRTTVRFGGNTSCVQVEENGALIILDAGSGIRPLGARLMETKQPVRASLFITHTHWDHIQGFPFFAPAYAPDTQLTIYGPSLLRNHLLTAMEGQMDGFFFPITLDSLSGTLNFREIDPGEAIRVGEVTVTSVMLTHPGFALGYRLSSPRGEVCYITDWEPLSRYCQTDGQHPAETGQQDCVRLDENVMAFCQGADLMICDSQYDCEEYSSRRGWGHACIDDVVQVALDAQVQRLALFHHDPTHDDARIDRMVALCREKVRTARRRMAVFAAQEGRSILLGESDGGAASL